MVDRKQEEVILAFVKDAIQRKLSRERIKQLFKEQGYPEYIAEYYLQKIATNHHVAAYVLITILVIAAGVLAAYLLGIFTVPSLTLPLCVEKSCFIEKADNCLSARFVQDEQGMIFEYRSRSCVLTKTVMQIGDDEDIVVRQALEKKSLTCAYQQGFFNVNWLNTLTIDIDKCSGDLKDALEILLNR